MDSANKKPKTITNCEHCEGAGFVDKRICPSCDGKGYNIIISQIKEKEETND